MESSTQDVHPNDQAILEPVAVADVGVGDEVAGARIADNLVDIDRDGTIRLLGEVLR